MTFSDFQDLVARKNLSLGASYETVWLRAVHVRQPLGEVATMTLDFACQGARSTQQSKPVEEGITMTQLAPDTQEAKVPLEYEVPQETEADLVRIAWHAGAPDMYRILTDEEVRWEFNPMFGGEQCSMWGYWTDQVDGIDEDGRRREECPFPGEQPWNKAGPGEGVRMEWNFNRVV